MAKDMIEQVADWLLIIGGANWALAITNINLVTMLATAVNFGMLANIIYGLVGASAVYKLYKKFA